MDADDNGVARSGVNDNEAEDVGCRVVAAPVVALKGVSGAEATTSGREADDGVMR